MRQIHTYTIRVHKQGTAQNLIFKDIYFNRWQVLEIVDVTRVHKNDLNVHFTRSRYIGIQVESKKRRERIQNKFSYNERNKTNIQSMQTVDEVKRGR